MGNFSFPHGHPSCKGVSGEPHLSTFDDLRYDLQAAGEFIAARSLDDNMQVQVRMQPYSSFDFISVATAAAAQVGERRVMIAARTDTPLRIDGQPFEIPEGEAVAIDDKGAIILRRSTGYSVVWPDGTNLHVETRGDQLIDMHVLLAEARDGRVEGIGGNADDDASNDFRTRDGKALAAPPGFEVLYAEFAESWRITQEESLFHYGEGESTETYTDRSFPSREVTLDDLDSDARADAEKRCRAGGVVEALALEQCIFDIALTGDDVFIASALLEQTPPEFRDPAAIPVRLRSPREVTAGSEFEVTWEGAGDPHDVIHITEHAQPYTSVEWKYAKEGSPMMLRAPAVPGEYAVIYTMAQSQTALATEPLTVTAVTATLQLPPEVPAGSEFEVNWEGPGNPGDVIAIAKRDAAINSSIDWTYANEGSPVKLRAPAVPGEYVVTYRMAQSQTALATEPLTVTAVKATLQVPSNVPAGSDFEVIWEGPGNPGDMITIAKRGAPINSSIKWKYTRVGSPIKFLAPDEPGEYEVRYVMGQSGQLLKTRAFEVR